MTTKRNHSTTTTSTSSARLSSSQSWFIVVIFVMSGLLITSTLVNIRCSQQQFAALLSSTTTDSTKQQQQQQQQQQQKASYSTMSPFDQTIQIAQRLIDDGLPSPKNDDTTTSPEQQQQQQQQQLQNDTANTSTAFDLTTWQELRTQGGLQDLDRIKLGQIYSQADSVFEYGLGESTYIANAVQVRRYVGVDSDATWVATARDTVKNDQYRFYFADIGKTAAWGYPVDRKNIPVKSIYQYQIMPLSAEPYAFDVYMSDGRWRIPCMIASFLHASARGANTDKTMVLLHDCFRQEHWKRNGIDSNEPIPKNVNLRLSYKIADHLLDLIDHSGDRLCVYKRKKNTTDEQLLQFWEDYYTMLD